MDDYTPGKAMLGQATVKRAAYESWHCATCNRRTKESPEKHGEGVCPTWPGWGNWRDEGSEAWNVIGQLIKDVYSASLSREQWHENHPYELSNEERVVRDQRYADLRNHPDIEEVLDS